MPMNQGINLLNPNYVPVVKDQKTYYGGSQMWFSDNKVSTGRLLHNYGCGTIATADLLYLVLQNQAESNSLTDIAMVRQIPSITKTTCPMFVRFIPYIPKQNLS